MGNKTSKKEITFYYKGKKQKIKYFGPLEEAQMKTTLKQMFKIEEPIEQIFFKDEDGDILILNNQIPSGISIHLFVEPNSIPKNPTKELKVEDKPGLLKFHWILQSSTISDANLGLNVIQNKYLYTTVNDYDTHPKVRSSCTFESGVHFFVLRKPSLSYYTLLLICDENKTYESINGSNEKEIGIFHGYPEDDNNDLYTINLGILVDMEHKKCVFYNYDTKTKRKISYMKNGKSEEGFEAPIDFDKAKLLAWLKRHACNPGRKGITILNEGCIPIPSWV